MATSVSLEEITMPVKYIPDFIVVSVSIFFSAFHLHRLALGYYPGAFDRVTLSMLVLFTVYQILKLARKMRRK